MEAMFSTILPLLAKGEAPSELLDVSLRVNSPLWKGQSFDEFGHSFHKWFTNEATEINHDYSIIAIAGRVEIHSYTVKLVKDSWQLPMVIVIDIDVPDLPIRLYHSVYPLGIKSLIRHPILKHHYQSESAPDVLREYFDALSRGDAKKLADYFAPTGYFREPSGNTYKYVGRDEIQKLFTQMFANGIGVTTKDMRTIHHDTLWSFEHNMWPSNSNGDLQQAGIAIYNLNSEELLLFAEITDNYQFDSL